jgi:hypothetical protein
VYMAWWAGVGEVAGVHPWKHIKQGWEHYCVSSVLLFSAIELSKFC